jgi:hypothetical protein
MQYARSPRAVPLCRRGFGAFVAVAGLAAGCGRPTTPAIDTAPSATDQARLCSRIDAVLDHARNGRLLDAGVHGAWQVVHGILAFGPEFPLDDHGQRTSALDYLLRGGELAGWKLRRGRPGVLAIVEEGSTMGQGHPDQWLGYLSQCGVAAAGGPGVVGGMQIDTPLTVGGEQFTLADLLAQAQHDIRPGQEATWTLMALSAWLPTDASWVAGDGAAWTTERVVQMEAEADIDSAACGGAHRLYGLAAAVDAYRKTTAAEPTGGWAAAAAVLDECIERARRFQQPDGSFSVHYFERPGTSPDVFARLGATGHVFEVVVLALDDERLTEPWVVRAADRLVTLLEQTGDLDVECGALYHAAHGLAIYRKRVCP